MTLIGKLHPVFVHFPIALVLTAAAAEFVTIVTALQRWRAVAVVNIQAGAAMGVVTAMTGWIFATSPMVAGGTFLDWHRWIGLSAAASALAAAILSTALRDSSPRIATIYRVALLSSALLVAVTAHLGGTLVWGARFFQP
jgi:uncharacterized membrane protein